MSEDINNYLSDSGGLTAKFIDVCGTQLEIPKQNFSHWDLPYRVRTFFFVYFFIFDF